MSWLGGLSPTIVTALGAVLANKFMAPTVLLVAAAGVSLLAGGVLMVYAPAANKAPVTDATVMLEESESS
jgi:predicted phage tail protein